MAARSVKWLPSFLAGLVSEKSVRVKEVATPSTPAAGYVEIYPKSDKRLYTKDSDGNERAVKGDRIVRVVLDGGGTALTTGAKKVYVTVPITGTITKVRLLADVSGSIVIDVWKDTYANFPPVVGDSITASAKPTLSTAQKSEDSTLTGWTTAVAAGDILEVNVDSVNTISKVFLDLYVSPS